MNLHVIQSLLNVSLWSTMFVSLCHARKRIARLCRECVVSPEKNAKRKDKEEKGYECEQCESEACTSFRFQDSP